MPKLLFGNVGKKIVVGSIGGRDWLAELILPLHNMLNCIKDDLQCVAHRRDAEHAKRKFLNKKILRALR